MIFHTTDPHLTPHFADRKALLNSQHQLMTVYYTRALSRLKALAIVMAADEMLLYYRSLGPS